MQAEPVVVSVIVLNWNGQRYLEPCLSSLYSQTYQTFEVVLVDNGSSDGSCAFIEEKFAQWLASPNWPRLRLVELASNQGFSGGNQAGLVACNSASRFIATLNNDTQAAPDWLELLVAALLASGPAWGAVCGPMLFASTTRTAPRIASAGIEVRRDGLVLDRNLGDLYDPEMFPHEIFGACAGAALYRRAALDEVGFFDPLFFAYLEDADLAWRLRLVGWRTLYLPPAVVWHEYSGTGKQGSPFKSFQLGRNRLWVILKNWPGPLLLRYLLHIITYDLAAGLYSLLIKGDSQPMRGRLAALHPRHLRRVWGQRCAIQSRRSVAIAELQRWLQAPYSPAQSLLLRRLADRLASTPQ